MHTNDQLPLHTDIADELLARAPELKPDPEQPYGPEGQPPLSSFCGILAMGYVETGYGGLELFVCDPGNGIFSAVRGERWDDVTERGGEEVVVFHRARGWAF